MKVFALFSLAAASVAFAQSTTVSAEGAMAASDVRAAVSAKSFTYITKWQGRDIKMFMVFAADGGIKVSGNGAASRPGGTWSVQDDGKLCRKYEWNSSNVIARCDAVTRAATGELLLGDMKLALD